MTAARLEAKGLYSGYRNVEVLHGIEMYVSRGEVMALFGPNGAGKTTTLLTLAGILPVSKGAVIWNGTPTTASACQRARMGLALVFDRSVFMGLSVEDNLRLGRGRPERALEVFPELKQLLRRRAGLLSGGEQQMLTLARALAAEPSVMMIDELTLGLAPVAVSRLFEAIRQAAESRVGVLLVEQQIERALRIADRGYVLSRGLVTLKASRGELEENRRLLEDAYLGRS